MLAGLRKLIQQDWYRRNGANPLLLPFASLYGRIIQLRRDLYERGKLAIVPAPVPVIVVGNITAGGTGKSPVVGWLAKELASRGCQPGIVSRGYGGSHSGEPLLLDDDTESEVAGDEPVMLFRQTALPVCVARDRAAGVARLAEEGCDVVIADDGLQHYRMGRHMELAVIDGTRGFGNGCLLPAGPLREPVTRLKEVDAVLVNGASGGMDGVGFELQPGDALQLSERVARPLNDFAGKRVWAVAGIGNPQRFYDVLTGFGITVDEVDIPDHGRCDLGKLTAQRRQPIIMTHKDAVKYRISDAANAWYVPVTLIPHQPEGDQLIERVVQRVAEIRSKL